MTQYIVILYNIDGQEIYKEKWIDYKQANDFIFNSQFDNKEAAAGKLVRVTEYQNIVVQEKILLFGMWTPVNNPDFVSEYIKFMRV